jgi:hypothetical protein
MRPLLFTLIGLIGLSLGPVSHALDPGPPQTAGELARYPNAPSATAAQKVWIDTVIKQNYDRVNACHKDALKRDPRQVAFYNVMLQLGGDGIVRWGEIKATTSGDPLLDECVLDALKTMDYSRADTHDAFVVAHTMVLTPVDYPHEPALMKKNRASVEACYAEAQARVAPTDLRGVVAVRFVTREGKIAAPEILLDTTGEADLSACVLTAMASWRVERGLSGRYQIVMRLTPEKGLTLFLQP